MLVYANYLSFQGVGAEEAIFKAVGAWLKEQLGFGLHPDQLRQEGEFNGYRGDTRSWLRIYATNEEEPEIYSWVLKNPDEAVRGRQWIAEVGFKKYQGIFELSCIVKTDEQSTLVVSAVMASQPRVIRYVVNNIRQADHAEFAASVPGLNVISGGQESDSYRSQLAKIERFLHRPVQYLNNILEQDHRAIKRRVNAKQRFREFQAARRTIQGYEAVHMIRKGQARWVAGDDLLRQIQFIDSLFDLAA